MTIRILCCGFLAVICLQLAATQILEWCDLESCNGRRHITCDYPGGESGPACANYDFNMLDLRAVQGMMLDAVNKLRSDYASGKKAGYPKAEFMGEVGWNVTGANLARRNVRQCESLHDGCRNTPDYDFVGQNIGWSTFSVKDNKRTNIEIIMDIMKFWISQEQYATPDAMASYKPVSGPKRWLYCAQLLKDQTTRMGCACVSKIEKANTNKRTILLTCNFDLGLAPNCPVYKPAAGAAGAGCTTGVQTKYPGLCNPTEVYDVNNFISRY